MCACAFLLAILRLSTTSETQHNYTYRVRISWAMAVRDMSRVICDSQIIMRNSSTEEANSQMAVVMEGYTVKNRVLP